MALHRMVALGLFAGEDMRRGGEQNRLGKLPAVTRPDLPLAIGAAIPGACPVGEIALAGERLVDQPHHRTVAAAKAEQRPPDRHAGNEGTCSVDRVDYPDMLAVEADIAVTLPENAIFGHPLPHHDPDAPIGRPE